MKNLDLGTLVSYDAKMYNLNLNQEKKENLNTFQQQIAANVGGSAPQVLPSAAPSAPFLRGKPKTIKSNVGNTPNIQNVEVISKDDVYHSIAIQMSKIKIGDRSMRADIYPNLMRDIDSTYKIKLTCDATDQISEIIRGASERIDKKTGQIIHENRYILNLIEHYKNQNIDGLMMGRLRYRAKPNFVTNFNRQNIPYALCVLYPNDNKFICHLHLWTEVYTIVLSDNLTEKQKQCNYVLSGTYKNDLPDLEDIA